MRHIKIEMSEEKKSVEDFWQEIFINDIRYAMRKYIRESPVDAYKKREFLDCQFEVIKSTVAGALVEYDKYQKSLWQTGIKRHR